MLRANRIFDPDQNAFGFTTTQSHLIAAKTEDDRILQGGTPQQTDRCSRQEAQVAQSTAPRLRRVAHDIRDTADLPRL